MLPQPQNASHPSPVPPPFFCASTPHRVPGFRSQLVAIMLFCACVTAGLKIGLRAADAIILRQVYGPQRVEREHLRIVNVKPTLLVSNGDVLKSHAIRYFLIACAVFLAIGAGGTLASMLFLPRPMRLALQHTRRSQPSGRDAKFTVLAAIIGTQLSISLLLLKPIWLNAIVVAAAFAIAHFSRSDVGPSYRR
jgi:hypothetical protein